MSLSSQSFAKIEATDPNDEQRWYNREEYEPMEGARLAKWIRREYAKAIGEPGSCPFTGFSGDEELLDPLRAFLLRPVKGKTWQDLADDCGHAWAKGAANDWEYSLQDEQVDETIRCNEYEFLEDGTRSRY